MDGVAARFRVYVTALEVHPIPVISLPLVIDGIDLSGEALKCSRYVHKLII